MNNLFLLTKINLLGTFKKNSNKGLIIFKVFFQMLLYKSTTLSIMSPHKNCCVMDIYTHHYHLSSILP